MHAKVWGKYFLKIFRTVVTRATQIIFDHFFSWMPLVYSLLSYVFLKSSSHIGGYYLTRLTKNCCPTLPLTAKFIGLSVQSRSQSCQNLKETHGRYFMLQKSIHMSIDLEKLLELLYLGTLFLWESYIAKIHWYTHERAPMLLQKYMQKILFLCQSKYWTCDESLSSERKSWKPNRDCAQNGLKKCQRWENKLSCEFLFYDRDRLAIREKAKIFFVGKNKS